MRHSWKLRGSARAVLTVAAFLALATLAAPEPPVEIKLTDAAVVPGGRFGQSVDVDGTTIAVGAYNDDPGGVDRAGAVYLFERQPDGTWPRVQQLVASDVASGDEFGKSVDLEGDRLVVGAPSRGAYEGQVYVFELSDGVWTEVQKFRPADSGPNLRFGYDVALEGDLMVIGTNMDDYGPGAAYVYERRYGVWEEARKLTASDPDTLDDFGIAVAVSGDTIVVGALFDDENGTNAGAAYVFERSAGIWYETAKLMSGAAGAQLGRSVDVEGDTILVGAPRQVNGAIASGAVHVFERTDGWAETQRLTSPYSIGWDMFGFSVSLDGDMLVTGAFYENSDAGAAYVFARVDGVWTFAQRLVASDREASDYYGLAVALDGTTAVISSDLEDEVAMNAGAAYVYEGLSPPEPPPPPPPPPPPVTEVHGYMCPHKVNLRTADPKRPRRVPRFTTRGMYDTGPGGPADMNVPGTLFVGTQQIAVTGFEPLRRGRVLRFQIDGVRFDLKPAPTKSSRGTFAVRLDGNRTIDLPVNGPVEVRFTSANFDIGGTVHLDDGAFHSRRRRGQVLAPALDVGKARARIRGDHKDTLAVTLGFATGGTLPAKPMSVTIGWGSHEPVAIPDDAFKRQKERDTFRGDIDGITYVTIDYRRERITMRGRNLDLGGGTGGPADVRIEVTLGEDARAIEFVMVERRGVLRY